MKNKKNNCPGPVNDTKLTPCSDFSMAKGESWSWEMHVFFVFLSNIGSVIIFHQDTVAFMVLCLVESM